MPKSFDFDAFFFAMRDGCRAAFRGLRETFTDQHIYAYGISTTDDVSSVGCYVNTEEGLARATSKDSSQDYYYRWCMNEWVYESSVSDLPEANRMLSEYYELETSPDELSKHVGHVFDTCIRAMEALIEEGYFGSADQRQKLFIHIARPDSMEHSLELESTRRLNTPDVFARFPAKQLYG